MVLKNHLGKMVNAHYYKIDQKWFTGHLHEWFLSTVKVTLLSNHNGGDEIYHNSHQDCSCDDGNMANTNVSKREYGR
jgi:hypothetical protein